MKPTVIIITLTFLIHSFGYSQEIFEWRPENRTGVSSETGLLKSWPEEGPELVWTFSDLTKGYSSPSFSDSSIFITGTSDSLDILYCLDMNGKLNWEVPMGRAWNESYPDSRSTPTVEGNRVYTCSGFGDLCCFDALSGDVIWKYEASEKNAGGYGRWGISESLILDGNKIYFSPGGKETMTVALDKNNGGIIWKTESLDDNPTYTSPILIDYADYKMIINASPKYIFAINAANGEFLWKVSQIVPEGFNPNWEVIKCVTPLYHNGRIYQTVGYNVGAMMIDIAEDGKSAGVAWTDSVLDIHHGGAVLIDGYIYGSNWINNGNGNWCCIDWNTGKKMWEEKWNCKGSIISAEGLLYIYDEKRGNVGLIKATPEKFELISTFQMKEGKTGPFWSHPVIHKGILYLRHSNALSAYNIKE